ncbi:MAG TPA: hypothetical protein VF177_03940 [Anaerolineae bacterium]
MDALAELLGLTAADLTQLIILGVILLVALLVLRVIFRLTTTLFRLGCFGILLIVAAVFFLQLFG